MEMAAKICKIILQLEKYAKFQLECSNRSGIKGKRERNTKIVKFFFWPPNGGRNPFKTIDLVNAARRAAIFFEGFCVNEKALKTLARLRRLMCGGGVILNWVVIINFGLARQRIG